MILWFSKPQLCFNLIYGIEKYILNKYIVGNDIYPLEQEGNYDNNELHQQIKILYIYIYT